MDNTANGQNKLIVLIAVGIIGAAAGQHLLKPAAPPVQQVMSPWGPGYATQQPIAGYPGLSYPQPAYGPLPPVAQYAPNGQLPIYESTAEHSRPMRGSETVPTGQRDRQLRRAGYSDENLPSAPDEFELPARQREELAFRASEPARVLSVAPALVGAPPVALPTPEIAFVEDQNVLWDRDTVLLSASKGNLYLRIQGNLVDGTKIVSTGDGVSIAADAKLTAVKGNLYGPVPFTVTAASGSAKLSIKLTDGTLDAPGTRTVTLALPASTGGPTVGTLVAKTNRLNATGAAVSGIVDLHERYIELSGTNSTASQIEVIACGVDKETGKFLPIGSQRPPVAPVAQSWTIKPDLGILPIGSQGQVLVLAKDNSSQYVYATPIKFTLQSSGSITSTAIAVNTITQYDGKDFVAVPEGRANRLRLKVTGAVPLIKDVPDGYAVLIVNEKEIATTAQVLNAATAFEQDWTATTDGIYQIKIGVVQGDKLYTSQPQVVEIRRTGPKVVGIAPDNLALTPGINVIDVQFTPETPLDPKTLVGKFVFDPSLTAKAFDLLSGNKVRLTLGDIPEGSYTLTVTTAADGKAILDLFGNALGATSDSAEAKTSPAFGFIKPIGSELSSTPTNGLKNLTGPYVVYPEFTKPREPTTGFNPSDKVVTKVARLYYFRDAHRVVQLINRGARSYNRQAVDMQQQLADNARRNAENAVADRQAAERAAVLSAQNSRAAEASLSRLQQSLTQARQQLDNLEHAIPDQEDRVANLNSQLETNKANQTTATGTQLATLQLQQQQLEQQLKEQQRRLTRLTDGGTLSTDLTTARSNVENLQQQVTVALGAVQTTRNDEAQKRETSAAMQFKEDATQKDLFRREVAAAHEDPDTFAPGNPGSQDPIEQVSLSVIGEGLIQLRGPSKGVNLARTLINQIDAPVGQVKVAVHTIQVNGEHAKRMEPVIGRIQRYVDHSRFLTTQSGQMLRNAVTLVASRRADQAVLLCEGIGQAERDQKYIEAFFGREFLAELRTLDSEFLHTGNKLLSLHSMDSTSLANALFLLSLAKNDVREEILSEFERMVTCQLPEDEMQYFNASNEKYKFGPMFHKQKFVFMGHNAKFVSLRGFFNADVAGSDTMTPMQREFIRLAQIFKSRLVTEIELQQRVMERSLIEDRFSDFAAEMNRAAVEESAAREKLQLAQEGLASHQQSVLIIAQQIKSHADNLIINGSASNELATTSIPKQVSNLTDNKIDQDSLASTTALLLRKAKSWANANGKLYSQVAFDDSSLKKWNQRNAAFDFFAKMDEEPTNKEKAVDSLNALQTVLAMDVLLLEHLREKAQRISNLMQTIVNEVYKQNPNVQAIYSKWLIAKGLIHDYAADELAITAQQLVSKADQALDDLMGAQASVATATRLAESSRRPLDHKKFLDMLIDDVEDKFIELMEGTRAHTANIDNYLSRLGQALEDDFNTQFYFPAFKGIREASRFWDVNMGQVETTTILTNNRMLAKVSPQATMEFDLPKRDILIQEAFQSAQAAYNDYGALLGDPTFLALTKMYRGQPASAMFGSDSLNPLTRNVLPGLPSSTDEKMVAQNRAVAPDFPSALESLIPDPAIYKFETGTGYEIRPVIQPDGQAVVFHFNYMYTTNIREPVRADEKHLGRVKRHFIDTDVQTGNYEMREVSKYQVALKASRTSRGVPLLEDVPVAGILFRPLPSQESSIQENIILAQSVIFPTLFDLMGLRWAPAVADLDSLRLQEADFVTRSRQRGLRERVFDYSSQQVDDFLRIPQAERRTDLYRSQETTPFVHPNGYSGPGMGLRDGSLREGYAPELIRPESRYVPGTNPEGAVGPHRMHNQGMLLEGGARPHPFMNNGAPQFRGDPDPSQPPRPIPTESSGDAGRGGLYAPSRAPDDHSQRIDPAGPPANLDPRPGTKVQKPVMDSDGVPFSPMGKRIAPGSSAVKILQVPDNSPIQLQSYRTESKPDAKSAVNPQPGPRPSIAPTPQRLPSGEPRPNSIERRPMQSEHSTAIDPGRLQQIKDIPPGTNRPSAVVPVNATALSKFEPVPPSTPAKKKLGIWPKKQ